jgi:hypothetical protein
MAESKPLFLSSSEDSPNEERYVHGIVERAEFPRLSADVEEPGGKQKGPLISQRPVPS